MSIVVLSNRLTAMSAPKLYYLVKTTKHFVNKGMYLFNSKLKSVLSPQFLTVRPLI